MSNLDAVKKVMMYQNDKTGFIKEPTVKEMADLVVLVLNSVKTIERAIESKRLDIDKKYAAPVEQALNKNQSETAAVLSWVTKEVNGLLALGESAVNQTTAQLETQVQQALANIRSGKDGIVTEAEIQRAADMALGMLELPDFDAMVSEAFTKNGEAIRNALELLSGDERYKVEIADVVGLQEMLSQLAAIRANGGGGIGKTQVYNFIRQAIDEGIITSGGVTTFTALTDAPNSYVGQAGKFPKVNATEDGLEFATISGGGDALTSNPLSQFAPTTKAQLDGVISDGNVMYVGDAPTAHTHPAANITDFDTEVSNNTDVAANTAARHAAVTVTDSAEINFTLTGQDITASLLAGSIDETKLDASVNASLDLADSSVQPGDPLTDLSGDLPFSQIAQIATTRILGRETAGTGDIESLTAAQARNVIGLDTDDSPHFTAVNIGHATDTTVTRVSAGVIAVEGVTILRTSDVDDVPVNGATTDPISSNWAFDHEADTSTHGVTTVAGISETQTFTNKTISDTANTLGVTDSYDFIVYRSGGNTVAKKTSDGTTLSTNTDASVVLQAVVDQVDASTGTGGRIFVKPGTYAMASTVTIQGDNTSNSPEVSLHGSGVQATIFNPASGVNGFTISNRAKVSLRWFAIYVSGASDGIKVTNSSIGQRGCWQSEFKNIYINGYDSTHTGWGINAENFFRSVMENIEMNQVGNGMLLKAIDTSTGYNPGDSTFTRMFIELRNRAGGSAYQIDSPSTGDMNQMVFVMCEGYGGGTGQTGVLLSGASGNVNHTSWIGINLENFDTIIDIQSGRNNVFDLNYVVTRNAVGTTYFKTSSNAYGNKISCKYMDTYPQSVVVINDANTVIGQRNRFENIVIQGSATTLTFTRVDATYLYNIFDNAIGGGGVLENANSSVTTNAVTINATSGYFTDTTDITSGTSRADITLTNQAIRSTSVVSCFMMSAPDANAMLVASCVPIDGSCTISIRNVGAGTQTSTYTMGFIVKQ